MHDYLHIYKVLTVTIMKEYVIIIRLDVNIEFKLQAKLQYTGNTHDNNNNEDTINHMTSAQKNDSPSHGYTFQYQSTSGPLKRPRCTLILL